MKKLNDVFNLPEEDDDSDIDETVDIDHKETDNETITYNIEDFKPVISKANEISREIRDTENIDKDFDELSKRSMEVFELLVDIGQNIEDKHVSDIFDVASKMMTNSISAKTHKMERKLKAINLEIQNHKADIEQQKLDQKIKERAARGDDSKPIDGDSERILVSREDLIRQIIKEKDK